MRRSFLSTSPASCARSLTSRVSIGVMSSRFTTATAPSSSPWYRTGTAAAAPGMGGGSPDSSRRPAASRPVRPRRRQPQLLADPQPHLRAVGFGPFGKDAGHPDGQILVGVELGHPPAEVGQHLVRAGAPAVNQPVRQPLQTAAHRLEDERKNRCHDEGDGAVGRRLRTDPGADGHDQHQVDGTDQYHQRGIDEGAPQEDADVIEVVTENRDPDRRRQRGEAERQRNAADRVKHHVSVVIHEEAHHGGGNRQHGQHERRAGEPLDLLALLERCPAVADHQRARGQHGAGELDDLARQAQGIYPGHGTGNADRHAAERDPRQRPPAG